MGCAQSLESTNCRSRSYAPPASTPRKKRGDQHFVSSVRFRSAGSLEYASSRHFDVHSEVRGRGEPSRRRGSCAIFAGRRGPVVGLSQPIDADP